MAIQKKEPQLISRSLRAEVKRIRISEREKAFADLLSMGWVNFDAYVVSGLYNPIYSKEANQREMSALMENNNFATYLKISGKRARRKEKEVVSEGTEESVDIDMATELSKEHQLKELLIAKSKQPVGSKEWLDIKKMIADITQAKKEEIQTEDNTIHYYLPMACTQCELYQKSHKKK